MTSDEDGPLYVIADTYQLARSYATVDRGLGHDDATRPLWRYVDPRRVWEVMRGRRPGRYAVVTVGRLSPLAAATRDDAVRYLAANGWTCEP